MDYFRIAKIVKTKGLKGEVKIYSYTDNIERFKSLDKFYTDKQLKEKFEVEKVSIPSSNMVNMKIKGVNSIDEAQAFVNKIMYIAKDDAYELEEGDFYISDMIGIEVFFENGEKVGELKEVLQYSANDIYVVKNELGKEFMIPAVYKFVPTIDIENKKMIITPIKGMLE